MPHEIFSVCLLVCLWRCLFWLRLCLVHADSIQSAGIKWESGVLHMRGLNIERQYDLVSAQKLIQNSVKASKLFCRLPLNQKSLLLQNVHLYLSINQPTILDLFIYVFIYVFIYLICLFIYLFIYLCIYLSVYLFIYLFIYVFSIHFILFQQLGL
jgi:hypothetical protein